MGREGPRITHYTADRPRPFRAEERGSVTILFGGLTWKHERLIQGVFHNLGHLAEPLPNVARGDLHAGKELIDVGACCPTSFVTGNLANFLRSKAEELGRDELARRYVYLTAGACGSCRFGQYHQSYSLALESLGLRDFRVLLLSQDQLDQESLNGLDLGFPFTLGAVWAVLCADLLTDLECRTRPYETVPGQTDRVLSESIERLYLAFRDRPRRGRKWGALAWHLLTPRFARALRETLSLWEEIEVDRLQAKPKVKITGEFWLQTHEGDGNYRIKRWLEEEGAEVIPPPVAVWLDYWMRFHVQRLEERRGIERLAGLKVGGVRALQRIFRLAHARLRRALGGLASPLPDQYEIARLAAPYYHNRLDGGEGDMLVGKALLARRERTAHMICELSPYSCLPNTMSVGAMAAALGAHPDLLYAPIEVKGDGEVHALSRCQMVLGEARRRAGEELEEALDRAGLTLEEARERERRRPALRRATCRLRPAPVAGTAARYVLHLGRERGARVPAGG